MVMRNRHDGPGPAGWWDDVPPKIRARLAAPAAPAPAEAAGPPPAPGGPGWWLSGLGPVLLTGLAVIVANVVLVLLAVSYVAAGTPAAAGGPADPVW